jgi:sulfur carrier protein ThiS
MDLTFIINIFKYFEAEVQAILNKYIYIDVRLFSTLKRFSPDNADRFPVKRGMTIRNLLKALGIPDDKAKLIFIDGVKGDLESTLYGEERVGIFPPVGGG